MSKENFKFQAEVGKILNIVANSLYSEKEIFIREYISNVQMHAINLDMSIAEYKNWPLKRFKIIVSFSKKNKTISISDNGIEAKMS